MENYRTEEEQVEALKRWWDENGRSIVFAVLVALGAGFGWQAWKDHREQVAAEASLRYEAMVEAVRTAGDAGEAGELTAMAEAIKTDFPGTTYAQFAALHLARVAVISGNLDEAEAELRWVLTQNPAPELERLAELRLARVIAAQGQLQKALDIVSEVEAGAYAPAYAEAEGDFYDQMGDRDAAIEAYQRALTLSAGTRSGPSESLRLKLDALSPVPARDLAAVEE